MKGNESQWESYEAPLNLTFKFSLTLLAFVFIFNN